MSSEEPHGGLHIDSDWKAEAALEKERLAAEEAQRRGTGPGPEQPAASFYDLLNLLALQVAVGLGGMQGPGGERIPPNPMAAQHHIDLLEVLRDKTKGNLTQEEQQTIDAVLYELQMQFVGMMTGAGRKPFPTGGEELPPSP